MGWEEGGGEGGSRVFWGVVIIYVEGVTKWVKSTLKAFIHPPISSNKLFVSPALQRHQGNFPPRPPPKLDFSVLNQQSKIQRGCILLDFKILLTHKKLYSIIISGNPSVFTG